MDAKRRLAFSILEFLRECNADGTVKPDDADGVDVALQCLGEAFGVNPDDPEHVAKYSTKPATLLSIFEVFLNAEKKKTAPKKDTRSPERPAGLTDEQKAEAEKYKNEGNARMPLKEFDAAIDLYTKAIDLNPDNAVYYANRAAAYSQSGNHQKAVDDSLKSAQVDPKYSKAYSRLGHAYFCLGRYEESADAFSKGLALDPDNATMKSSLHTAQAKIATISSSSPSASSTTTEAASSSSSTDAQSRASAPAGGMPDLASMLGGGGPPGGGMPDLSSLLQNPAMMRMAQQAMQNPEIMRMAQQFMGGGGGGAGAGAGGGTGSNPLANLMNNPDMMNMAQQFMGSKGRGGGGNPGAH